MKASRIVPTLRLVTCCLVVAGVTALSAMAMQAPASPQGSASAAQASQPAANAAQPAQPAEESEQGFPIANDTVRRKCGTCHRADEKGRLSRISFRRTTPEGWEETIKRMVSLNHVSIEPAEAREVLRYLADHQGLAPEEAAPASFETERRIIEFQYTADRDTERTCNRCHSMGRVMLQRRTKSEWELLIAMHRGYYPLVDSQSFLRNGPRTPQADAAAGGRQGDDRQPMEQAIAHLSAAFPLNTPAWTAWSATMRPPRLDGRWAVSGYQPGKGPVVGQVTIKSQGSPDSAEFTTETTLTFVRAGRTISRTGRALVYTGYQWRGRSQAPAGSAVDPVERAPDGSGDWREVMTVDPEWRHAKGRWFTGGYDELGIDVELQRIGADPILLGAADAMLKAGGSQQIHLFGANLPSTVSAADVSLGPDVTVDRVVSAGSSELVVQATAAARAVPGRRKVLLAGATGSATVAVYSKIDLIKVSPESGLARVGGVNVPKQYAQFEAVAFANGPDGQPDTKDDIELGPVDATWRLEEFTATYNDEDKRFVGAIDPATGLFTPNIEGPNPERAHNTNNLGDVWVVASLAPEKAGQPADSRKLEARAHLLVSPPLYIRWYDVQETR
jgi:quinohemoprotein amine dehydrogenase